MNKLRIKEGFAGIGAWSKALKKLGIDYEIIDAIEHDKKTIESYNIIHNTNFLPRDISDATKDVATDIDIFFYSPPCQAFSQAGRQNGFKDPRGTLFFDALEIIRKDRPKFAIMENVKGLTQKKFENEFKTMLKLLEEEGYKNYIPPNKVLNAKDYGIPQNRERVFVVSIRNDIKVDFKFPDPIESNIRLKDLLEDNVDEKFYLSAEKTEKLLSEMKEEDLRKLFSLASQEVLIVDDTQGFDGVRLYRNYIPSQRSKRNGLKTALVFSTKNEIINVGNVNPSRKGMNGNVFYENGISPTITTNKGEGHKILCVGNIYPSGGQNGNVYSEIGISPTISSGTTNNAKNSGIGSNNAPKIMQLGLLDIRGNEQVRRVYDPNGISLTLNTMQGGNRQPKILIFEFDGEYYYAAIRKLTPLECLRLMGFDDEDYYKLKENKISDTQIYKMAGNSIVVNVIEHILINLIPEYIKSEEKELVHI